MNMRVLKKSRRRPKPGDIFIFQMPDKLYRYGRVIRVDATIGGFPGCTLLYIYSVTSETKMPVPVLKRDELLLPPKGTNRQPWLKGYFETLEYRQLELDELLPAHCFWDPVYERYVDADGQQLDRRCEPCGFDALSSYRTIDDDVSKALGIPLAPDRAV